jgi:hypothetical protein
MCASIDLYSLYSSGWLSESGTVYYPLAPQLLQYQLRRQQNVEQLRQNECMFSLFVRPF